MQDLENWIDNVQDKIFSQQFQDVPNEVIAGSEWLALFAGHLSESNLKIYNEIIGEALIALQKSDFLFLADLLEFRLKPFLKNIVK